MAKLFFKISLLAGLLAGCLDSESAAQSGGDYLREMQVRAIASGVAEWGHWGLHSDIYSSWTKHSHRLAPVFSFGMDLKSVASKNSVYRDRERLRELYQRDPDWTLNERAEYFDQTDIFHLQQLAAQSGKKYVFVIVFDGLDWNTLRAASIYRLGKPTYSEGRGQGLAFQDYDRVETDYGHAVTAPHNNDTEYDVNAQLITRHAESNFGGYCWSLGGDVPWSPSISQAYLTGTDPAVIHAITDSAAAATSMFTGKKTYCGSINIDPHGNGLEPIAVTLQKRGFGTGIIGNVPVCHATTAAAYANNVTRTDYQDLSRDLLGLPSVSHKQSPLLGVDVLIGTGWGEWRDDERLDQGDNFVPGNKYFCQADLEKIDARRSGKYVVVQRQPGQSGRDALQAATQQAIQDGKRLFGLFGIEGGHLPYRTADGDYRPAPGVKYFDQYTANDLLENPKLADMTSAALQVLERNPNGFWLLIEAGDVDWAMHNSNIDDAIGAIFDGEEAFTTVTRWAEDHNCWDETAVIVTADHGHLFVLKKPESLCRPSQSNSK